MQLRPGPPAAQTSWPTPIRVLVAQGGYRTPAADDNDEGAAMTAVTWPVRRTAGAGTGLAHVRRWGGGILRLLGTNGMVTVVFTT